jgi:hypothetical protein
MSATFNFRKDLRKVLLLPLLTLFLIPALTLLFVEFARPRQDIEYLEILNRGLDENKQLSSEDRSSL